ncbi:helix-turn-helix transcriptional regulator [Mesorhizobium sp. KR2-14]|uniref:helix-turn-helix transcriptional regulator n=1 Tax=Mesorhizobium sp. KR2-14 TaxID=3156610 RepID=UPI0032B33B2B
MTQAAVASFSMAAERQRPFGSSASGLEQVPAVTIPDAVRRCRWIAADLNASAFGLFFVSPSVERARLTPCFDSDHPCNSPMAKFISDMSSEELTRHSRMSTTPCWWSSGGKSAAARRFEKLDWTTRIAPLLPETDGIAFPVFAERNQCGFVMFFGNDMGLESDQLPEIHARCFTVFTAVARIRADDCDAIPSVSKRELECLKLTANGLTSEEIATRLKLSVHTANQYLTNTTQKLNAVNRMHAVAKALRLGLIE